MKLVKFDNGSWGVRTFWFFGWHYMTYEKPHVSYNEKEPLFRKCRMTKEQAESLYNKFKIGE